MNEPLSPRTWKIGPPRNLPGVIGAALLVAAVVSFAFLVLIEVFTGEANPYVGLIHYLALPLLGGIGLVLWGIGIWLRRRRVSRGEDVPPSYQLVDFSKVRTQQQLLLMVGVIAGGLVFLLSAGGVRAIEYTESESFCGDVCHTVMGPEFTAYQHDAHAEIACVDCHVGEGAGAFVRAKVRGIGQVWAVATGHYERPIPAPVEDIREPNDTCESCHWPERNIGEKPLTRQYHLTEGFDRPWTLDMAVFVGGGDRTFGFTEGAHWHMKIANDVEYVALDEQRQEIALVRFTDAEGSTREYRNLDLEFDESELEGKEALPVDCLTCHNRPAHGFPTPVEEFNEQFRLDRLSPDIPGIRWIALELFGAEYESTEEALTTIAETVPAEVADEDPEWAEANPGRLDEAVGVLQQLFARMRFPEMRADWRAYPGNLGHWSTPGCFRCHAGNMEAEDGTLVSYECNTCHLIKGQGRIGESWEHDPEGLPFVHPADDEVMEGPILCHECHDGVLGY